MVELKRENHVRYLKSVLLEGLPGPYVSLDTSRVTAVYFVVLGLDILGALDEIDKEQVMDYVLAMQISADESGLHPGHCGFIGGSFLGQPWGCCGVEDVKDLEFCVEINPQGTGKVASPPPSRTRYMQGHLAITYTSLAILLTLDRENGLARVNKTAIVEGMKHLQQPDGSFRATFDGSECDMRFLYCACAISAMLGDWSGVDVPLAISYVRSCITYEGGIALVPGAEAHGGSCYTAVASLALMGRIDEALGGEAGVESLKSWCYGRVHEEGGYNGRTNKDTDSCYSFWVGATLSMLGAFEDYDHEPTAAFLLKFCQATKPGRGGFRKTPTQFEDVMHTFYSLCWLSMSKQAGGGLREIDVRLATCADRLTASTVTGGGGQIVFS